MTRNAKSWLLSNQGKPKMLEGPAKGLEHKSSYKDFTVTEPWKAFEPESEPPLPPPSMPPVAEGASESAQSVSEAAKVVVPAAAAQSESDQMGEAFMAAFP